MTAAARLDRCASAMQRCVFAMLCALCQAHGAAAAGPAGKPNGYAMALPLHPGPAAKPAEPGTAITRARVRSLYRQYCAGCHQLDGSGAPASGIPDMRATLGHFQRSERGRAFLVQAPGARNAGISDRELAALSNWLLYEFSRSTLPADFQPYTTEEVGRWRANPPLDVAGTRAAIASTFPSSP